MRRALAAGSANASGFALSSACFAVASDRPTYTDITFSSTLVVLIVDSHVSWNRIVGDESPDDAAPVLADLTPAEIEMMEVAARRGVDYVDLDHSAYDDE